MGTEKRAGLDQEKRSKSRDFEAVHKKGNVHLGIDIGSVSSDLVLLNEAFEILFSDYKRTLGRPLETILSQLTKAGELFKGLSLSTVCATGTIGRYLAQLINIPFINEVPAQAAAIFKLYPEVTEGTIIEMGGQDSKLIFLSSDNGNRIVHDFALNTVCAAGTGSFLDQQAQRLGVSIEEQFSRLALESTNAPRMAGRCSVFAKSDMIHLQQQATPTSDIIAGLCTALARNLKSNLGCGREFKEPIFFTGGVAANTGVVRALEKVLGLPRGELVVPKQHFFTGAIGAIQAVKGRDKSEGVTFEEIIGKLRDHLEKSGSLLSKAPRREVLNRPKLQPPASRVYEDLLDKADGLIDAYLGVDVGSISTNVVVMDKQKRVLAKAYLMTAGKPLEAIREGLSVVGKKVVGRVNICGAATTGSGRYLTGDFIGADIVINEITAQAAGSIIVNPKVDTIFEIGGQDSKYISLENGVVVDFEMNHACAAGTGSFLEEQAQRLDINIDGEFEELAFKSASPIKLGERCTVFMESDLLSYQQQGAQTKDLVAGLSYSIVANYLNRVVGRRKIGNNICFQGGTAFNKAVWSAFEAVTGKTIIVPDHHEVTGALGAASIAMEFMQNREQEAGKPSKSTFKGFESIVSIEYSVESFMCEHCTNNCEIKKVKMEGSEPLYYGSRCDRYNIKSKVRKKSRFDAFKYRNDKLLEYAGLKDRHRGSDTRATEKTKIGIPMSLVNWQYLPLFARFFGEIGFEIVLSNRTTKQTIRRGVEAVTAQPCFPVKVAFGHIAELVEKQVDYIFIPSVVSAGQNFPDNKHNQLCPYVQSLPYQAQTAFQDKLGKTKILTAPLRMGEGKKIAKRGFIELAKKLNVASSKALKAAEKAFKAQNDFEMDLRRKGNQILNSIQDGQKLFVLVSRPYNGCDEGVNLQLTEKLAELGVEVIPMDMLDLSKVKLSDEVLHKNMYWAYGQKILRAAEIIRDDPRLFAIYLSNFSCGPDSFIQTFFKDIMAKKPCLQLEIDEHSADAGIITRLEAFLESLKNYKGPAGESKSESLNPKSETISNVQNSNYKLPVTSNQLRDTLHGAEKRTIYIPYMSDCSYGFAAGFKAFGQPAEVIPIADENALLQGRAYTTGKECLPCAITAGDMLKLLRSDGFNPEKAAFFMPGSSGPCRFGMYSCLHRLILKYADFNGIPVIAPNQDSSFYKDLAKNINGSMASSFLKSMWTATVGVDLLRKVILCIRPFSIDKAKAQMFYNKALRRYIEAIENRCKLAQLVHLIEDFADDFASVQLDKALIKPRVGIVGEIYVRSHPFANMDIISRLETLGAACDLASLAEWVYYTNFTRGEMAGRRRQFGNWFTNKTQNYLQHKIERTLAEPLEAKFGRLTEQPVEHVIKLAQPYIHHSFEGEAILSVGKMIEYHHQGFGGVVNVMPFTCMPSTIVSTQTMRISRDCNNMPILNLSFDGQEDPALTTRLEAFVEQIRSRQVGVCKAEDLLARVL